MISSGVSTCSAASTPRACRRSRRSLPVARELLERKARRRPPACRAVSTSRAPGLRTVPFQTQPSRSKTKPRRPLSNALVARRSLELGDGVDVQPLGALGDTRPGELLLDAPAAGAPHGAALLGVVEQPPQGRRQLVGDRKSVV